MLSGWPISEIPQARLKPFESNATGVKRHRSQTADQMKQMVQWLHSNCAIGRQLECICHETGQLKAIKMESERFWRETWRCLTPLRSVDIVHE